MHFRPTGLLLAALLGATAAQAAPLPPRLADCDTPAYATTLEPTAPTAPIEAAAYAFSRTRWRWPGVQAGEGSRFELRAARTGQRLPLRVTTAALPAALAQRHAWVGAGVDLLLPATAAARLPGLLRGELWLVQTDSQGRTMRTTALQMAGLIDDLYARAAALDDLGVRIAAGRTRFRLWAPTARSVSLCLYADGRSPAARLLPMRRDAATGSWQAALPGDLSGGSYTFLVDVHVRGSGPVRNRVTDPYSISLNTDSQRSWIGRLDAPELQPPGWADAPRPRPLPARTDAVIYELQVRDFSATDDSVPAADRGKYAAFTHTQSRGMQHLRALAAAGVTDLHLLPVFDFATVPEQGCRTPDFAALDALPRDGPQQQAEARAMADGDCYNWGYDPWHYGAPEGSYASDADKGAVRIVELRRMVQALHAAGLRVGMDLVYNHTAASGQKAKSVLDRIVPGYYQRLNAQGAVETSTCCDNTATEHRMMAKLMIDTAVTWARDHRIDSFRFDLMGHQPRAAMESLQRAVDRAAGRPIHLIGEGWNFGEVADGKRFVQASQASLNGSGIATFSDRGRDAVRGGGCCDDAAGTLSRQGWINGLHYAPNPHARATRDDLLRAADLVRVGLAGTLRGYRLQTVDGSVKPLSQIDYAGQGAGYASQPDEVVNYVENHDNPTLFDINVLKLPPDTPREDRARVQVLGGAVTAFSQGIAYFHAGVDILRSKSGDRNSYDSGDAFNRLDWSYRRNHWGSGLPREDENGTLWPALRALLARDDIAPTPADIAFARDAFRDLLKIRASSTLFRLRTADEINARLRFFNTGPEQDPTVIVGHLDGRGLAGAGFAEVLYAINVGLQASTLKLPELQGRGYVLHPVHRAVDAADQRPAQSARWEMASGTLTVPPRTALVYVLP